MRLDQKDNFILQDISIIFLSVIIAFIINKTDLLSSIFSSTEGLKLIGSFVAGIFFTSIFTTAPAIVTLGKIASSNSILVTALVGAMGAVMGDIVIFKFIKDRLSIHLLELIKHDSSWKKLRVLFKLRYFRWITFLMGGLIIASPFPDELGISLLGFSKMKLRLFIPISFTFNFIGILLIGIIARSL